MFFTGLMKAMCYSLTVIMTQQARTLEPKDESRLDFGVSKAQRSTFKTSALRQNTATRADESAGTGIF